MPASLLAQLTTDSIALAVGGIIGIGLGLLLYAMFLSLAFKWVARIEIGFRKALFYSFICILLGSFLSLAMSVVTSELTMNDRGVMLAAGASSWMIVMFIMGLIYGTIKDPDTYRPIGPLKGLLIALVAWLLGVAVMALLAAIVYGLANVMHIPLTFRPAPTTAP